MELGEETNMASKTNKGVDSSVVLTPFFYGTYFKYWKIRMRTRLNAEGLCIIVANVFEERDNDRWSYNSEYENYRG